MQKDNLILKCEIMISPLLRNTILNDSRQTRPTPLVYSTTTTASSTTTTTTASSSTTTTTTTTETILVPSTKTTTATTAATTLETIADDFWQNEDKELYLRIS